MTMSYSIPPIWEMGAKSSLTSRSDENGRNERRPLVRERAARRCVPPAFLPDQTYSGVQQEPAERPGGDAFEDVIYGSESEIDSEEEGAKGNAQNKRPLKSALKRSNSPGRLRADGDDPLDLLEGVGAHGLICECSYSLSDLVIGSNWTGRSSPIQEAPQTRPRSVQIQDRRRDGPDDYR